MNAEVETTTSLVLETNTDANSNYSTLKAPGAFKIWDDLWPPRNRSVLKQLNMRKTELELWRLKLEQKNFESKKVVRAKRLEAAGPERPLEYEKHELAGGSSCSYWFLHICWHFYTFYRIKINVLCICRCWYDCMTCTLVRLGVSIRQWDVCGYRYYSGMFGISKW